MIRFFSTIFCLLVSPIEVWLFSTIILIPYPSNSGRRERSLVGTARPEEVPEMNVFDELKNGEHQHPLHSSQEANDAGEYTVPGTLDESSSSETLGQDPEKRREDVRSKNPRGLSRTESGVDVQRAEADFAQLSREFSGLSQNSRRASRQISRVQSRRSIPKDVDVEKRASSDSSDAEPWDLAEVLRGSRAADYEAGIKSKRIGNYSFDPRVSQLY